MVTNERAMDLVLPPHPDVEILRTTLFNNFYSKFETFLNSRILKLIDLDQLNNKQNEVLFNSLVIEFKMVNEKSTSGIIEPLFVKFGSIREDSYLLSYLLKLFKSKIDEKLKLVDVDVLENCVKIYKDYIIRLTGIREDISDR